MKTSKLNIVIFNNDNKKLFKALTSIHNQIGFHLNQLNVTVVSQKRVLLSEMQKSLLKGLKIDVIFNNYLSMAEILNQAVKKNKSEWITFMDSRDMFFADGSLLDFMNIINNNNNDLIIMKYVHPLTDVNQIIGFQDLDYKNILFGKYYKFDLLKNAHINFDVSLNRYLYDDFASKAIAMAQKPLWFDLLNYYLNHEDDYKDSFYEFCDYRLKFINYMKHNFSDKVIDDITWSIVRALYIVEEDNINFNAAKPKLKLLFDTLPKNNHPSILINEFKSQSGNHKLGYSDLISLVGGDNNGQ